MSVTAATFTPRFTTPSIRKSSSSSTFSTCFARLSNNSSTPPPSLIRNQPVFVAPTPIITPTWKGDMGSESYDEAIAALKKLLRMWEAINFKNENEIMGLEMVFVDDKGESIQVYIRKNHMKKYKALLEESEVYAIRNFKVVKSTGQYKVVPNEHRIYFNTMTLVRKLTTISHEIPPNVFFFTFDETHEERVNNNTLLTDIVGCVVGVGEIQYVGKALKRDLQLISGTKKVMKVTLWGAASEMSDFSSYTTPLIAIITSTTIKTFRGELTYATTTATRIYLNPDIPEAKAITLSFSEGSQGIKVLASKQILQVPLVEQMSLNRRSIAQILDMTCVSDDEEHVFTVLAMIVGIDHGYGWCYVSCNQCSKKLVPTNGIFVCNMCNKECSYPIIRYKIHVRVSDESGSTTFVIFNSEAEKLIDSSANKFVNRLGVGSTQFPEQITNLTGKTFVFKIKLTDYNLKDGFENYTVLKIFKVETLEDTSCVFSSGKEVGSKGKRDGTSLITDENGKFPNDILAPSEIGSSICKGGSLLDPVTPQKESVPLKKLKTDK